MPTSTPAVRTQDKLSMETLYIGARGKFFTEIYSFSPSPRAQEVTLFCIQRIQDGATPLQYCCSAMWRLCGTTVP